ncbi:MAG: uroporphyrinogen decarboxylase [Pseudomonadota bacterium]|nr:uroporphyrinogen decarboxylase [Pseudomonadota bacterium]
MNDRFLRALARQAVDRTPVWIMRQAGRYLPEYRKIRERAGDFLTLCKTPDLACEVSLQPMRRFDLDAAILFSDILTIPDAMGLGLTIEEGFGPRFERPIASIADIDALPLPDPDFDLRYVIDAVALTRRELDGCRPLIGFAGSPWTLATYMVEGQSSRDFAKIKRLAYESPEATHRLLEKLARAVSDYLIAQIHAGVDAVMVFDTWGGTLSTAAYLEFSLEYLRRIVSALPGGTPSIVFTKGGGGWIEAIAEIGCTAVGLDWTIDIGDARQRIGDQVALQGNLDPAVMLASPATIEIEAKRVLDAYGPGNGHVFNLGHGITPAVPPEHVQQLIDTVHSYSRRYHEPTD